MNLFRAFCENLLLGFKQFFYFKKYFKNLSVKYVHVTKPIFNSTAGLPRAWPRSWGTIVLSREQMEQSRTIPLFRKKERTHSTRSQKYWNDL